MKNVNTGKDYRTVLSTAHHDTAGIPRAYYNPCDVIVAAFGKSEMYEYGTLGIKKEPEFTEYSFTIYNVL